MTGIVLHQWDGIPLDTITEMMASKSLTAGRSEVSQTYVKRGAIVPWHAHPGEQMIYVLQGALRVTLDGDEKTVREQELLQLPAGAGHQVEALDDTFVLDLRTA